MIANDKKKQAVLKGMGVGFASLLLAGTGLAQDATKQGKAAPKLKDSSEKVSVTGSRIKRTEAEGINPVVVIGKEELEKTGASTVSEVMQNLTVSSSGSYSSSTVNDTRGTVTMVDLRGLGPENTLVLLDGRRLPEEGGLGVVDLSQIPMAAVERIEVLKESASAIYGSDAAAGVVNIITRKDLNGSIASARAADPYGKGGQQSEFSYVTGSTSENFKSFTMLNYQHTEAVYYRDRDWTKTGLSLYSSPANYQIESQDNISVHPNCPESQKLLVVDDKSVCTYNYGATSAFSPESTKIGILNNMEYNLNSSVTVFSALRASKNTNLWNMAPNAGDFRISKDVANANLQLLRLSEPDDSDVDVYYRAAPWGVRTWQEENTTLGGNAGVKGSIAGNWDWTLTAGHTESKKDSFNPQGFMLKQQLADAVGQGRFNTFETALTEENQKVIKETSYTPFEITQSDTSTYNADFTGEIFRMSGGDAALAVGVSRIDQGYSKEYDDQTENDNVFGVEPNESSAGTRNISAAYFELGLPVMKGMEFQVAARHDVYSDFGSTTNPKLGFRYQPTSNWMLRAGAGTGFKAPTLADLHMGNSIGLEDINDAQRGGAKTTEVKIYTHGNKDLKQETSRSYTLGTVVEPVNGLALGLDYWYIKIRDSVTALSGQDIIDAKARGQSFEGVPEPQRAGGSPDGRLLSMEVPLMNLGEKENAGLDFNASYGFRAGATQMGLGSDYSRKLYSRRILFPGNPQEDTLGRRGEPAWRVGNSASVTLDRAHTVSLRQNIIASTLSDDRTKVDQRIDESKTYDLQYAWAHPWSGSVAVGALNVLNTPFPRDNTVRPGDQVRVQELYSANGRTLFVKAEQRF